MSEDLIVGWHHRLNRHEFEQAPGDGEGTEGWHAAVHGVTKSWIQLSYWTIITMINVCIVTEIVNLPVCALLLQFCLTLVTLCTVDSQVLLLEILQARILEWVVISYSRGFSSPGHRTHVCQHFLHCRRHLYLLSHLGSPFQFQFSSVAQSCPTL